MTTVCAAPIKVLIVEDYKLTRVGLRCALNNYDEIDVINEAQTAEEALLMIEREKPDVVIMDLGLPNMNGLEATIEIMEKFNKKLQEENNIKVIILTSHDREEEITASLGAGATGYCMKDIDPETLADVIKQVHKGACFLDSSICKTALKFFPKPENTQLFYKQETKECVVRRSRADCNACLRPWLEVIITHKKNQPSNDEGTSPEDDSPEIDAQKEES